VVGCWHGYLSGARCRLAYGPADAIANHCSSKIQIGFTFLVLAHLDSPKKGPLNGCVCVFIVVRLQCMQYIVVAYCYRCSVVCMTCLSVCVCIGLGVYVSVDHSCEHYKMAKPIDIPFGLWTQVRPRNHVLAGDPDSPGEVQFLGTSPSPF